MKILVIDEDESTREVLLNRVNEAVRQAGLRRTEVIDGNLSIARLFDSADEQIAAAFFGPGCYNAAESIIQEFRSIHPLVPAALVLDNEVYADEAVELRRVLTARILAVADIAQMAGFLIDCEQTLNANPGERSRGIVSTVQLKGGVGGSTTAAALASCWARHDLAVALVDLCGINPQISDWARAGMSQKTAVSEFLRIGEVPQQRINEIAHPVEGFDGKLVVIPQPDHYRQSFHFQADVLDGAPSSAVYMESLLSALRKEFDVIVIDTGCSWGISTFASLMHSQHVLLVTDDDGMSVRRTLDNLQRLVRDSGDDDEFDLSRWSVLLNAYTAKLLSPKELSLEIRDLGLFPETAVLYTVPFSEKGRQWGGPGETLYELAEPTIKLGIERVAFNLIPFKQNSQQSTSGKLKKSIGALFGR